jgi:hypothetical protein
MTDKYKVVKIKPGWERIAVDENGGWHFAITDVPLRDLEHNERISEKVLKEMESRRKL